MLWTVFNNKPSNSFLFCFYHVFTKSVLMTSSAVATADNSVGLCAIFTVEQSNVISNLSLPPPPPPPPYAHSSAPPSPPYAHSSAPPSPPHMLTPQLPPPPPPHMLTPQLPPPPTPAHTRACAHTFACVLGYFCFV